FLSSRRRHTRFSRDWSSDVCSSDLWPVPSLQPQQLVNLLRKLPPRLYSSSSSQAAEEDEVHITVAAVRYRSHERDRDGVASTWRSEERRVGKACMTKGSSTACRTKQ